MTETLFKQNVPYYRTLYIDYLLGILDSGSQMMLFLGHIYIYLKIPTWFYKEPCMVL